MEVKYFYVSAYRDKSVYQTQIIDWIKLYAEHGIDFNLIQLLWLPRNSQKSRSNSELKDFIKSSYSGKVQYMYDFSIISEYINSKQIERLLKPYIAKGKVIIFSRSQVGYQIEYLKKKYGDRIVYYYDLRGASVNETILSMKTKKNYSLNRYKSLAKLAYSEYLRQKLADKIFSVSKSLMNHYIINYDTDPGKFVLYPCLSSMKKFYYSEDIRLETRKSIGYTDEDDVFIFTGGVSNAYQVPLKFLKLFERIREVNSKAKMLLISHSLTNEVEDFINSHPLVKDNIQHLVDVPNNQIVNYLNAADFGFLLRENIIVNNVASPSKFPEYMLCGLPTIISEALHDFANYTKEHNAGIVFPNSSFDTIEICQIPDIKKGNFNRKEIAKDAQLHLSKELSLDRIVEHLIYRV